MVGKVSPEKLKYTERYKKYAPLEKREVEDAFSAALQKIDAILPRFTDKFPDAATKEGKYPVSENVGWTTSFWTGMLWLAYEVSGDAKYKKAADVQVDDFARRLLKKDGLTDHDIGFLYTLSCVASYCACGDERAKAIAVVAAEKLSERFQERSGFIQSGGKLDDPQSYKFIVDCLMNIPLLFWAAKETGYSRYFDIASTHLDTTIRHSIREDGTSFHHFMFDYETGKPSHGHTFQGYSDDSCWARGQSWAVYGFPISYRYTGQERLIPLYKLVANCFLNKLPEDLVAYWDLVFQDGSDQPRDSSASAIVVCGMQEMDQFLPDGDPDKADYKNAANAILRSLIENYSSKNAPEYEGVLLHSTYALPQGHGIDECNIFGDYYYMEALARSLKTDWKCYW